MNHQHQGQIYAHACMHEISSRNTIVLQEQPTNQQSLATLLQVVVDWLLSSYDTINIIMT